MNPKNEILYMSFVAPGEYNAGVQRQRDITSNSSVNFHLYSVPLVYNLRNKQLQFAITRLLEIPSSLILLYDMIFNKKYNKYKVIIMWPLSFSFLWVMPLLRLFGKKVIYDYNDDFFRLSKRRSFPYNIISFIFIYVPQHASKYVSNKNLVTIGIYNRMSRRLQKKSLTITTGFDNHKFTRSMSDIVNESGNSIIKIGYFGSIRKDFDLQFVLDCIVNSDIKAEIHLYGKNHDIMIPNDPRFFYHGLIEFSEVPSEIRKMDILISSFKYNDLANLASPVKVFEYMACGKAILSARVESIEGILHDGKNCLIYGPQNAVDFMDKLKILIYDSKLRHALGTQAYVDSKEYTWDKTCIRIADFVFN